MTIFSTKKNDIYLVFFFFLCTSLLGHHVCHAPPKCCFDSHQVLFEVPKGFEEESLVVTDEKTNIVARRCRRRHFWCVVVVLFCRRRRFCCFPSSFARVHFFCVGETSIDPG